MNIDSWQSFLRSQPVSTDVEHPDGGQSRIYDLSPLGSLTIQGPDARKFLQGQATCDFDSLSPIQSLVGAHCNTKGRALFSFRAIDISTADGDTNILLVMPQEIIAAAAVELKKYSVFSKVKIALDNQPALLGISGNAINTLFDSAMVLPTDNNQVSHWQERAIVRVADNQFLCTLTAETFAQTWSSWQTQAQPTHFDQWQLANIRNGFGEIWPGTEDEFIPQMLNFDTIGAISFKKGCYLGQEVVARMQYRGKLKRHMRRVSGTGTKPAPGTDVYSSDSDQSAGKVVISASSGPDSFESLVVVTDSAFASEQIYLTVERTVNLPLLPLPYAINN